MTFIYEQEKVKTLTFGDVQENQFFVNVDGYLCQKASSGSYNIIADNLGTPYARSTDTAFKGDTIKRILPTVTKIEF